MDISTFTDKLKNGDESAVNLRFIFQSVKCPQHGVGVRFSYDNFKVQYELVHLRTKSGDRITDRTLNEDIETVTDIRQLPYDFLIALGVVIQRLNNFLSGSIADHSLLVASNVTVNGFMFNK